MTPTLSILTGDCRSALEVIPDASVHCCVTSPPYFGLRDYGMPEQLGLEETADAFIAALTAVFRRVWRALHDEGTLWLNLGDSFSAGKQLLGIPWRAALALQADGWLLRQDIIWSKPNPMPESVTDRCTKAHEYIFMLTKSAKYFYDAGAIRNKPSLAYIDQIDAGYSGGATKEFAASGAQEASATKTRIIQGARKRVDKQRGHGRRHDGFNDRWDAMSKDEQQCLGSNKRSVWSVATKPYSGAHFATFPPELIRPCIRAGCPSGGTVLDPFAGSGTTGEVALQEGRNAVLIELNPAYCDLIRRRCSGVTLGLGI